MMKHVKDILQMIPAVSMLQDNGYKDPLELTAAPDFFSTKNTLSCSKK